MTCQIFRLNLPTCRTAMSRKTRASTMTAVYVEDCFPCDDDEGLGGGCCAGFFYSGYQQNILE